MNTIAPNSIDSNPSFHAIAESFLRVDGLPFAKVLSAESIEKTFADRDAMFAQDDIYSTPVVRKKGTGYFFEKKKGT